MPESEPPSRGVLDSLRNLCDSGLALVQNRIELFALEIQEEKARLLRTLILAVAAFFLAGVAVVMVTLTIVFVAGESARVPLLIALSSLYVLVAIRVCFALRRHIRSAPPPFHETVSELKKDRDWLSPRN